MFYGQREMSDALTRNLQAIGLTDKEARVYLAVLELGPSPVQHIARHAGVPRATTYLVLRDLKDHGLATTHEKGKKVFFTAEPPEQLASLVAKQADAVREQERLLKRLIPVLAGRGQFVGTTRPTVRFYEGAESLRAFIRDNILRAGEKGGEVLGMVSYDEAEKLLQLARLTWDDVVKYRQRAHRRRRLIFTFREGKGRGPTTRDTVSLPYREFPLTADITIVGNRVAIVPYQEPIRAVAIEDPAIAEAFRVVFNALWSRVTRRAKRP